MPDNVFADLPSQLPEELIETLVSSVGTRVQRIVSTGHRSPPGYWYDQEEGEWVLLLRGEATLRFADQASLLRLVPGDHVWIPPHRKHRVESTSSSEPTVWLTIFIEPIS